MSLSKNENMFYKKARKKQKDQRFLVERVEQRTSDVESWRVIYCATATNIEVPVKLIMFNTFGHEILPVDAV